MTNETPSESTSTATPAGRFAAGEDPAKREQILDGAWRVFKQKGFDAASMNDITREAAVSKGTIYVYFENKDELFAALIDRHRAQFALSMRDILAGTEEVRDGLWQFGHTFIQKVTCTDMIPAMRSALAVIDRMPKLSQRFFVAAPNNVRVVLRDFLQNHVDQGTLHTDDVDLAARQFIELATGTFFKMRLFGELSGDTPPDDADSVLSSAIEVFMAAYGTKKG